MEVWVVFEGHFIDIHGCSAWTWDFYGIYNSEEKAKEVITSLDTEEVRFDGIEYRMEKHSIL